MRRILLCMASLLLGPSVIFTTTEKAYALPFNENCASMQSYANALKWQTPTNFKLFESLQPTPKILQFACEGGYMIETTPMGRRGCQGNLLYNTYEKTMTFEPTSCRYQ